MATTTNRRSTSRAKAPDSIVVRYELHELPTAQHKAGLAGLLLQIDSMNERRQHGARIPEPPHILERGRTHAEIRFTPDSVQALFDDLYAAEWVEIKSREKWSNKPPKRTEEVEVATPDGGTRREKRYVYDDYRPTGPFLARYTSDGKEAWHKLWQDMLWAIPRGKPTTRGPFKERANGRSTPEGPAVWDALVAEADARRKGRYKTLGLSGAIMLGAQAVNAENVKFEDVARHALLLHFWQLTARIFVPEQIDSDGKRKFVGYIIAIPEISDLEEFCVAYTRFLSTLDTATHRGRPKAAVVSLPEQGALEFMRHLARLVDQKILKTPPRRYVNSIEFHHMVKLGKNIKSFASGHVPTNDRMIRSYEEIVTSAKNPLFLAGRLRAMLASRPWFAALADELMSRPWKFFVHVLSNRDRTPVEMIDFAYDVARYFDKREKEERSMDGRIAVKDNPQHVDLVIYRLVKRYVREKALARLGINADDPDWRTKIRDPQTGRESRDYQEARRHVASQLFLALRSRQAENFVQHFTATIGSVAQFLPEDQYLMLSAALMRTYTDEVGEDRPRTRDDIKTLTLLALAAHSRSLSADTEMIESVDATDAEEEV